MSPLSHRKKGSTNVKHFLRTMNMFWTIRQKCNIAVSNVMEEYESLYEMKNIFILPISLADEAYTWGEALIYRQYSEDLNSNIQRRDQYIAFDNRKKRLRP